MENGLKTDDFSHFVELHKPQLEKSGVPEHVWHSLFTKLEAQVFDAGEKFMLTYMSDDDNDDEDDAEEDEATETGDAKEEESKDQGQGSATQTATPKLKVVVSDEEGLEASDENSIYLIDHAWTYRFEDARRQLREIPDILARMTALMELGSPKGEGEGKAEVKEDEGQLVERVLHESWKYSRTYSINAKGLIAEERQPIWYILDEFGSKIQHADDPSCRLVPFLYIPKQIAFSLLFPIADMDYGDDVTVDYAFAHQDPVAREVHLLPWRPRDLTRLPAVQPKPSPDYLAAVVSFTPPDPDAVRSPVLRGVDEQRPLRVFSEQAQVRNNLRHPRFVLVDNEEEADILYLVNSCKDYRKISTETHQYVNQFPGEKLIITKDMLALTSRSGVGLKDQSGALTWPKWLPVTFDLWQSLPQFVSYFQQQQKKGAANIWICKPFNLARALDTSVTDNLNQIIRQTEEDIPKVACEYLTDPVLFVRDGIGPVKFDLRYIVLLSSVQPLKVHIFDIFWLRFANKPFLLEAFDEYQRHFTVMNYKTEGPGENFYQMLWHQFPGHFNRQNPGYEWEEVQASVHAMILEFFKASVALPPPRGITHCPWSRAMYGLDVMLKWDVNDAGERYMQPILLECNFLPDCERACWHRKEFFDDIFSCLFLGETEGRPLKELC